MSTAKGIEFYKNKGFDGFADAEKTIKFTMLMNNMFDALNRKYPAEGIKKYSRDLEVFFMLCLCCVMCCGVGIYLFNFYVIFVILIFNIILERMMMMKLLLYI